MLNDLFSLKGKRAVVTGASSGIGEAIAIALANAGADIVGVSSSARFAHVQKEVESAGRTFEPITADLNNMNDVRRVIAEAVDAMGDIDILVNNAGIIRRTPSIEFTELDWDDVMQVNLKSVFFMSQDFARHVFARNGHGKIINIASLLSFQGGILVPSYTASKSGLAGMTKTLANEWAAKGINVNAIAPGYIATNNTAAIRSDEKRNQSILDRVPAGRWGDPSDLAGIAIFLASRASDYCHGATYPVDGGWLGR